MHTDRARHPIDEPAGWRGRVRRWLGLPVDPPLRRPALQRLRPVRRSWPVAVWQARAAVLARTSLDEYLRARLAWYSAHLPVVRSRLPVHVEVAGGEIVWGPWEGPVSAPTGEGADAWAAALVSLEGPSILRETQELRARLASLDARSDAARRRAVELSERFAADVADGKLAAAPRLEDTAEQLGRPPVRSPGRELGLASVAITALLTEAWAIALPALSATGRSPPTVTGALRPETIEAVLTCAFALGISVGLLALALLTLRAAEAFVREATAAARRRVHVTALLAGILGAAGAVAAATLPAPRSGLPPPSHAFLLLSISAGTALLLRGARRERDERAAEAAAALAWDRERARALGERAQRLEELVWAEAAMREVDGLRQRTSTRLDQLVRRSTAAARLVARAEELARSDRLRLAQSLLGALERDRYEFVRQATARGATDLLPEQWNPPAEPHAGAADEGPATQSDRLAG